MDPAPILWTLRIIACFCCGRRKRTKTTRPCTLSKISPNLKGFNLGRYWTTGPQLTLYCPGPVLKKGTNEVIIFETDDVADILHISMDDTAQIDTIPHPNRHLERSLNH